MKITINHRENEVGRNHCECLCSEQRSQSLDVRLPTQQLTQTPNPTFPLGISTSATTDPGACFHCPSHPLSCSYSFCWRTGEHFGVCVCLCGGSGGGG